MWFKRRKLSFSEIQPEEIFLDSSNLPHLDESQFEGRVEYPLSYIALIGIGCVFGLGALVFLGRAFSLQIVNGTLYADISRENRLERSIVFAPRGIVYDRNGMALAWNDIGERATSTEEVSTSTPSSLIQNTYAERRYTPLNGLSHVLGFVRYPKQDDAGVWWRTEYVGVSGAELVFDPLLRGENGSILVETDARGREQSGHMVVPPQKGQDVHLTIDAEVQNQLYALLSHHAAVHGFKGGAAVVMDVASGELLALTSFPEYDNAAFTEGDHEAIHEANTDARTPLLNRAVAGLYTPGSIVKPIFAAAALTEGIIDPEKEINSTGQLVVPNPFDPSKPTIFRDWKAHGWVDMRRALAVSSDQYFYTIGGGFGGQKGLGIQKLDTYARAFGLGELTGTELLGEVEGVIPTPEWKEKVFGAHDPWRIGDTYITSIGQFGFQITPLQAVRFAAAIANGGTLPVPHLTKEAKEGESVGISNDVLAIVREGMRAAVSSDAADRTARALDIPGIEIAGKTGTAELGDRNQYMNSWVIGFWPSSEPRYAFAVVLEKAPAGTLSGAAPAMRGFFDWLIVHKPEYVHRAGQ